MSSVVKDFVGQWVGSKTVDEFQQLISKGAKLVEELKPYGGMVKAYKTFGAKIDITADELLDWLLVKYPRHGILCFNNREWYNEQIHELKTFIDSL